MCKKAFLVAVVVLCAVVQKSPAELHLKVDLALPKYNGGVWQETLKPGWTAWAQPRWHDMYGHDCVLANGTGEETSCGEPYEGKPGLGGTGIMAGMSCVYEGRGGLIAAGLEMCNLNATCGPPAVSGQVLYDPICNTWFQVTDFAGVPGANILLGLYNIPPGEYELVSYHNRYGGERNDGNPHWECVCNPQPPMSAITVVAVAAAETLFVEYGSNYEWQKFKGNYDLGNVTGVELFEGAYNVEIQQVTSDNDLVPSVIRFRTDGSAVLVVYEGNCCEQVPDDIRPQRESQRAILNAFEIVQSAVRATASLPYPPDGRKDVPRDSVLNWLPGAHGVLHDLYIGTEADAVENATDPDSPPGRGRLAENSFEPGDLGLDTTYYWRIDEVNDANPESPWKGELWSFKTAACLYKEDFELYYNLDALQDVWISGGGGWIEISKTEANQGTRSMELQYFNRSGLKYSEAGLEFEQPQDWTSGYDRVEVFFKGMASNDADKMYIALEDAEGKNAAVFYEGDVGDLRIEQWQLFAAELAQYVDVDMTAIKAVFVGAGDRDATRPSGASGALYIDDVRVCGSGGAAGCACPGNLNGDDQIDLDDLQAVAGVLLQAGSPFVVPAGPEHCGNLNGDAQVDLDDLQAVAGLLLNAGSPFVVLCD